MNSTLISLIVVASLFAAVFLGRQLRKLLPEHHLSAENKDTMKLAMGLVATMAALVLGLLLSSAKTSYDNGRSQVGQLAAKTAFLNRVLVDYGPETAGIRAEIRIMTEKIIRQLWPDDKSLPVQLAPGRQHGDEIYFAVQHLTPQDDTHKSIKSQASDVMLELAQLRTALHVQAAPSISMPLLVVVVFWLVVIFISFSLFAPPNFTATVALLVSAVAIAGSIFLILELDQPFGGFIAISSEPMHKVLSYMGQ